MSASPARMGATSFGMSRASYWLSASVLTMTSAPSFRAASRPAWNPAASPLLFVSRTMWSTPWPRATSTVRSVEPSSMTSHSTVSKPSTSRGRSPSVSGRVSSSFRQGIWMISFMRGEPRDSSENDPPARASTVPHRMQRDASPRVWPRVLLALLALGALVGFFVYPTYPNYDSLYSLIWGKEILHGHLPSFEVYRAPTEHPLALFFAALMSLFGTGGDRLM